MGKTKRNPTIELEVCPPDWTTFKAALAHYPTPEGIEDFEQDQGPLMMWASDVWAMEARQPPRFFVKGEDGKWRRKAEPANIIPTAPDKAEF